MGMIYPGDQWTLEIGHLGFDRTGEELVQMAAYGEPPFAVGVFGKWGSGKTSILRYCMARLGGEPVMAASRTSKDPYKELSGKDEEMWTALQKKAPEVKHRNSIRCIWFNPWQYQNEPNPLIPLLHEIRSQMTDWLKFKKEGEKLLQVSVESGIGLLGNLIDGAAKIGLGSGFGMGKAAGGIRQLGERYEREHYDVPTDSQRFALFFEDAVHKLLGVDEKDLLHSRMVIFIDDLDRCEDEHILRLLETLKLYLNSRYCVFVLGLDPAAVERALQRSHADKSLIEIREYLEKLFQGIIHVPICQNYQPFIQNKLEERLLSEDIKTNYKINDEPDIASLISSIIEPNPRKVKNFLNALHAFWETIRKDVENHDEFDFAHLVLLLYLKLYYSDVYRTIEYDPKNLIILANVFSGWKKAVRDDWPLAAFYAHTFGHILDIGYPTSGLPLKVEGVEKTGKIDEKEYVEAVDKGYSL